MIGTTQAFFPVPKHKCQWTSEKSVAYFSFRPKVPRTLQTQKNARDGPRRYQSSYFDSGAPPNWGRKAFLFFLSLRGGSSRSQARHPVLGQGSLQSHTGRRPPATCAQPSPARPSPALPSPPRYPASGPPSPALAAASPWSGPPRPRAGGSSAPRPPAPGPPPPSRTGR